MSEERAARGWQAETAARVATGFDLEKKLMAAGYRSCMGCLHHGQADTCRRCNALAPLWEPNELWHKANAERRQNAL